jgi:hypothetical protein
MKIVNVSLWLLIAINFIFAILLLCTPSSLPRLIEQGIISSLPKEGSILESPNQKNIPKISLNGPVEGESQMVLNKP